MRQKTNNDLMIFLPRFPDFTTIFDPNKRKLFAREIRETKIINDMISYLSLFRIFSRILRANLLKPERRPDPSRRPCGPKTILEILLIEHILDRAVYTKRLFLLIKSERVTRRQIAFPVALEAIN